MITFQPRLISLLGDFVQNIFYSLIILLALSYSYSISIWLVLLFSILFLIIWSSFLYRMIELRMIHYQYDEKFKVLIKQSGIINIKSKNVPVSMITNFTIKRDWADRILGMSKIYVDTAGSPYPEMVIKHIDNKDAEKIERLIKV